MVICLMGCGESPTADKQAGITEKTNITSGDISISVTPTTDIPSSKQSAISVENSKSTPTYTIKPAQAGKVQADGKLKEEIIFFRQTTKYRY